MVTIPRMVTIKLQPFFLSYMSFAPRNSYRTGIGLSVSKPDILPKLITFDLSLVCVFVIVCFSAKSIGIGFLKKNMCVCV